jgi:hypothetical protein
VRLLSGPVSADGYPWWQIELIDGTTGWSAGGPAGGGEPWLGPLAGGTIPLHAIAQSVQRALLDRDVAFFSRAVQTHAVECPAWVEVVACKGKPDGTIVEVIGLENPFEGWAVDRVQFEEMLAKWLSAQRPDLSDEFGGGSATVYATAISRNPGMPDRLHVIVTEITGPSLRQHPRDIVVFSWQFVDARWRVVDVYTSEGWWTDGYPLPSNWLTGGCGRTDDVCIAWQRWP